MTVVAGSMIAVGGFVQVEEEIIVEASDVVQVRASASLQSLWSEVSGLLFEVAWFHHTLVILP
jgi:hypothetical protein